MRAQICFYFAVKRFLSKIDKKIFCNSQQKKWWKIIFLCYNRVDDARIITTLDFCTKRQTLFIYATSNIF
eukprot:UN27748